MDRVVARAVIFTHSGRLGNQIFQYAAMRAFLGEDGPRLVLVDFDDLGATFDDLDAELLSTRRALDRLRLVARYRSRHLPGGPGRGRLGLVGPDPDTGRPAIIEPGRVLDGVGYYQFEDDGLLSAARQLRFHAHIAAAASLWWRSCFTTTSGPVAFVAVRRGDYLTQRIGRRAGGSLGWVEEGDPVALDLAWYRRGITELRDRLPGIRFVVVTDDIDWCNANLSAPDVVVSDQSPQVDLALMARCDAGVLSASSLAWWGARLAAERAGGPFLAPEFWLGHRVGAWWPATIAASHLTFRPAS